MLQNQIDNTKFTKTILMILVVYCHAVDFWTEEWFTRDPAEKSIVLNILANFIGNFHIYCFVLISGYLFAFGISKNKYKEFGRFIGIKAKRLLVPYFFISIVWAAPITTYFFNSSVKTNFLNYICGISPAHLWFLLMLFWVFAIWWIIARIIKKNLFIGLILSFACYFAGIIFNKLFPNIFQIGTSLTYVVYFGIGYVIFEKPILKHKAMLKIVGSALFIILFIAMWHLRQGGSTSVRMMVKLLMNIDGSIVTFIILQDLGNMVDWKNSKIFNKIAECSMTIYLFHQPIIYFVIKLLNGKINPYCISTIGFLVSFLLSWGMSLILLKFKPTRFLLGEKN